MNRVFRKWPCPKGLILALGLIFSLLPPPAPAAACCGTVYDPANHQANISQLGQTVTMVGESFRQSAMQDSLLRAIGSSGNSALSLPGIFTSGSPDLYSALSGGVGGQFGTSTITDTERAETPKINFLKVATTAAGILRAVDSAKRGYGQSLGLAGAMPTLQYLTGTLLPRSGELSTVLSSRGWSTRVYSDPVLQEPSMNRDMALDQGRTRQIEARRRQEFNDAALHAHGAAMFQLSNAEQGVTRVARFTEAMDIAAKQDLRSQVTVQTQVMVAVMEEMTMLRSLLAAQLRLDAARGLASIPVRQDMVPLAGQQP